MGTASSCVPTSYGKAGRREKGRGPAGDDSGRPFLDGVRRGSLGVEGEDEVVEGLLLAVLVGLEGLLLGLVLLQVRLLLAELLQVALVQVAVRRRLAQVGAEPLLVLDDHVDLPRR